MNIEKNVVAAFDKLYAQAVIWRGGKPATYLAASEGAGPCVAVDAATFAATTVWDGPGGTMTICQLNANGDFLAVQKFLPVFAAAEAAVVYGKRENGKYTILPCTDLPYIHRFEIVDVAGAKFFVGATLADAKESQQDWSKPGRVLIGRIPDDPTKGIVLRTIQEGITKNHGFILTQRDGRRVILVSGVEGLFEVTPPPTPDGEWKSVKIMDHEISDMAVVDFDNDGQDEIATIDGFHGNALAVYKPAAAGAWTKIYSADVAFGHALWGGKLAGKNRLVVGYRREAKELFCLTPGSGTVEKTVLGTGGPSQLTVWNDGAAGMIYSADREAGEAVLYRLTEA